MNKTTIKISVLAFLGFMTYGYAQQQQQDPYKGKVGINTVTPSATMDVQPNSDNARVEAKTNEGIIAPKLSKTRIANIETPVEGTLVYATDETTSPISAYTGGDTKVAKITEKGYYFYNGTEWVKAGSDANDQLWAQRDNGGVTETYLKPADANSDFVGYRNDRKFSFDLGTTTAEDFLYNSNAPTHTGYKPGLIPYSIVISSDVLPNVSDFGIGNNIFSFMSKTSILRQSHLAKNTSNSHARYINDGSRIVIKDVTSPVSAVSGRGASIDVFSNTSVNEIVAVGGITSSGSQDGKYANAVVNNNIGGNFNPRNFAKSTNLIGARIYTTNRGAATNIWGINNSIATYDAVTGIENPIHSVSKLIGSQNSVRLSKNGEIKGDFMASHNTITIDDAATIPSTAHIRGVLSNIITGEANIISTNLINYMSTFKGVRSTVSGYQDYATYTRLTEGTNLVNYTAFRANPVIIDATSSVENIYGVYVDDITGATNSNFAVYTKAGNIRFGDLKHSVSTNVASTGDRPVFVTADGVLKVGNASTALSRAVWETDGNHVKLAVKADGTDRTDNIITINDEGQMFASSFKGTNGATIFPDYVFQKYYTGTSSIKADYNFKSLSQVEDFVKENGHLPGYKSAETIKAQGYVDLMETQLTNVEKIEELYLHLMEKEKEVKQLKEELKAQKEAFESRLQKLEKLIQ